MKKFLNQALALVSIVVFSPLAHAQVGVDQMFANFSSSAISVINMVVGASFIMGLFLSGVSVLKLKEYSESGGRMSLKTPLVIMFVGVMLLALPNTITMATQTIALGSSSGLSVFSVGGGGPAGMDAAIKGVLLFVKMVGHIAIVRGFLIFKKIADGQQGGEMGRALTHIFGGAAAVNINKTIEVLANTVGMPL